MVKKFLRLFLLKSRWEAWAVIYALAVGATTRGIIYLDRFPGIGGWLLFAACTGTVFIAGAKLLDATRGPSVRRVTLERIVARARAA